jgi:uncharacterized protein YjcR
VLLSSFEQQQIHAAYKQAQTYHTTQLLPAISKHVTIAQKTTQFSIRRSQSQRQMDGWQRTVVALIPVHSPANTQKL